MRANVIHRGFVLKDKWSLLRVYLVYVRPILEYNSVTWSPHLKQDILSTEKVQRLFTKRLWKLNTVSYPERLHHLALRRVGLHFDIVTKLSLA